MSRCARIAAQAASRSPALIASRMRSCSGRPRSKRVCGRARAAKVVLSPRWIGSARRASGRLPAARMIARWKSMSACW